MVPCGCHRAGHRVKGDYAAPQMESRGIGRQRGTMKDIVTRWTVAFYVANACFAVYAPLKWFLYGYGVNTIVLLGLTTLVMPLICLFLVPPVLLCWILVAAIRRRRVTDKALMFIASSFAVLAFVYFQVTPAPFCTMGGRLRLTRLGGPAFVRALRQDCQGILDARYETDDSGWMRIGQYPASLQQLGAEAVTVRQDKEDGQKWVVIASSRPHRSTWEVLPLGADAKGSTESQTGAAPGVNRY